MTPWVEHTFCYTERLIQVAGFAAVIVTIWINTAVLRQSVKAWEQKTGADNRTQWWTRYTWAEELRLSKDPARQLLGWSHLNILSVGALTTDALQRVPPEGSLF
ncbi:MAG TPA: hypothetical protein DCM55_07980 [Corynebacterium variabile]|uniref:hypothetical protein n=1 Tax=Corynebacterium variabile TaxID=1727 RepID=UPI000ED7DD33|nr:hypothetical protein [Corynebacterium variabile]HAJ52361.1 hypothetical protein [Corynebacterium variabile]